MTEVHNIGDHKTLACECGSVRWCLLQSGAIECHECGARPKHRFWCTEDFGIEDEEK